MATDSTSTKTMRIHVPEKRIKEKLAQGWKVSYMVKRAYADGSTARDAVMTKQAP